MPRLKVVPRRIDTKSGPKKVYVPRIPENWGALIDANIGICIACGKVHRHIEQDAEYYFCSKCHRHEVFGLGTLAENGLAV
jgi:hypothetical protein